MPVASKVRLVDLPARDFEKITVSSTAVGLTTAKATGKVGFFLTVEAADIRYRLDGTDPDTDTGHLLLDGGSLQVIEQGAPLLLSMIRDGATDATVQVTYF